MGEVRPVQITTQALINAPIEAVWRAFNDPADILMWDMSEGWRTTWVSNNLTVDGRLELRIESRHGGEGFDFGATYTNIQPMRVIEWRTDEDRHVRVEFRQTDAGIVVHQTFEAEPAPSVDEQRQDWQAVLDSFSRHVASAKIREC